MRRERYAEEMSPDFDRDLEARRSRSRRSPLRQPRRAPVDNDIDDDDDDDDGEDDVVVARPRTGSKRTVLGAIRNIPNYVRLLLGLMRDKRVSRWDRILVFGAIAYVLTPIDFIPDFIPFLGQVDDIFLIVTALQRLIDRAGDDVLEDHWEGHPDELSNVNLARVASSASFFLPPRMRRGLRRMANRG